MLYECIVYTVCLLMLVDGVVGRYNGSLLISVQFAWCWTNVSDGSA